MLQKPSTFLVLSGTALGLLIGILDSSLHFSNLEDSRMLNIMIFILLFIGIFWSAIVFRNRFNNKFISYKQAFRSILLTGTITAFVISVIRFVFLNYISNVDVDSILNQTKKVMSQYTDDQIINRLSFIKFTYNPTISSLLYFIYYLIIVVIFAFFASFLIKRIDRDISL